jgi:hypothetical protein
LPLRQKFVLFFVLFLVVLLFTHVASWLLSTELVSFSSKKKENCYSSNTSMCIIVPTQQGCRNVVQEMRMKILLHSTVALLPPPFFNWFWHCVFNSFYFLLPLNSNQCQPEIFFSRYTGFQETYLAFYTWCAAYIIAPTRCRLSISILFFLDLVFNISFCQHFSFLLPPNTNSLMFEPEIFSQLIFWYK